jgi:hypothetical protein
MATRQGIDYMATQPLATARAFKANGIDFVARYYDNSVGASAKCLDAAEVATLHAAGLEIFTVFETCAGVCTGSCTGAPCGADYFRRQQGSADGAAALAAAQAAGQPTGSQIYFAVDYDASDVDLVSITQYFNGVYDALGGSYTVGVYGSYRVCKYAQDHWPAVPHQWQTYAWSAGQKLAGMDLYQYQNGQQLAGVSVDLDEAYVAGWAGTNTRRGEDMEALQRAAGHLVAPYVHAGTTLHLANPGPKPIRVSEVKTGDPDQLFAKDVTVGPFGHTTVAITADGGPLFVEAGGVLVGTLER